jgi:FkbH-like protein
MQFLIISDFTINHLSNSLKKELPKKEILSKIAPYNQVQQTLLNLDAEYWTKDLEYIIIWTLPENALKNFNFFLSGENFDLNSLIKEVRDFSKLIIQAKEKAKNIFVFGWTLDQTLYYESIKINQEVLNAIELVNRLNLILKEELSKHSSICLIDSSKIISQVGSTAYSPKLWYLSKTPFHLSVFNFAAKEIAFQLTNIIGYSKKVIVLDLDETLWGGTLGDDGIENIVIGGHNPIGEAFKDFQKSLKTLKNKGVILAISSKNDEINALNAIENHPEMILKKSDFATWKINWNDKAQNIQEIAKELNLSLDSFVFLDDNSFERERVKNSIPEVYTPDLPNNPMLYKQFLLQLNCFNLTGTTEEDKIRTQLYEQENNRHLSKSNFQKIDEWLKSINLKIECSKVDLTNFHRTLQLLNKTNQMNLQTHRYSENEFQNRLEQSKFKYLAINVSDDFGNAGLTGVIGLKIENESIDVTDFVLSCRVMGRKIEEAMLFIIQKIAINNNINNVTINFIPTDKNMPCFSFFEKSNFKISSEKYGWSTNSMKPRLPEYILLNWIN